MWNKNKTILALLAIIFLFSNFLCYGGELIVKEDAWKEDNVYRPNPVLFLHGFAKGSPESWEKAIEQLQTKVPDDKKHFKKYYRGVEENFGKSPGRAKTLAKPYLEIIDFVDTSKDSHSRRADENSSVDTYKESDYYVQKGWRKANDPGWADKLRYWVNGSMPPNVNEGLEKYLLLFDCEEVPPIIERYNSHIMFICHSMGGVTARHYAKSYSGIVDKLITIGTSHLGAGTAQISINLNNLQKLRGGILHKLACILFAPLSLNLDQTLEIIAHVDIDGDCMEDLCPGSDFLTDLNNYIPGNIEYYMFYSNVLHMKNDLIVSEKSQKGEGLPFPAGTKREKINATHAMWNSQTSVIARDGAIKLIKCLDDTEPVLDLVRVLESIKDNNLSVLPESEWGEENTNWTQHIVGNPEPFELDTSKYGKVYVEGKVANEYLPATSEVKIAVFKRNELWSVGYDEDELTYWGFESKDFGYVTKEWSNLEDTKYLKPYAEQNPAPAGFRYEAEFDSENPDPGVYEIKVFVENPAELKSQIKTTKVIIEPADYYFHVQSFPGYVKKDVGNPYQSSPFDLKLKTYKYGKGGRKPDDQAGDAGVWVNKLESTQGWWYNNNTSKWEKEKCLIEQDPEPVEFTTYAEPITVILSPLYKDGEQDGLYLDNIWDGTITINPEDNGEKSLAGLRYRKKDDSDSLDEELLLIIDAKDDAGSSDNGALKIFKPGPGTLASGYWNGSFGYLHKADPTPENPNPKPLLYKYPFNSDPIDLDFPEVMGFTDNYLGSKWYYDESWHYISTPQWTDPSWDWVRGYTLYTDKIKCNGVVYIYRVGSTYYVRIWTLTNGAWGYVTHSGWAGIDSYLEWGESDLKLFWKWNNDICYIIGNHFLCNGIYIDGIQSNQAWYRPPSISNNFTYTFGNSEGANVINIFGETGPEKFYWTEASMCGGCLVDTNCMMINGRFRHSSSGGGWYGAVKYIYFINTTIYPTSNTSNTIWYWLDFPPSPNGCDLRNSFDGGEDRKAINYQNGKIAGFDPVAGTWTDYGCPWEEE